MLAFGLKNYPPVTCYVHNGSLLSFPSFSPPSRELPRRHPPLLAGAPHLRLPSATGSGSALRASSAALQPPWEQAPRPGRDPPRVSRRRQGLCPQVRSAASEPPSARAPPRGRAPPRVSGPGEVCSGPGEVQLRRPLAPPARASHLSQWRAPRAAVHTGSSRAARWGGAQPWRPDGQSLKGTMRKRTRAWEGADGEPLRLCSSA